MGLLTAQPRAWLSANWANAMMCSIAEFVHWDQRTGSGIPGGFACLVILPHPDCEGIITALETTPYERSGLAQQSLDQHS